MNTHDWKAAIASLKGQDFTPWMFERPIGSVSTVAGSPKALLQIGGAHAASEIIAYAQRPGGNDARDRRPSGEAIDTLFKWVPIGGVTTTIEALRGLFPALPDPTPVPTPCEHCDGTGQDECPCCENERDCLECDGVGTLDVPPSLASQHLLRINGRAFDVEIIGPLLAIVPGGEITATVSGSGLLHIVGDGWRLLAANLDVSVNPDTPRTMIDFQPPATDPSPLANPSETAP